MKYVKEAQTLTEISLKTANNKDDDLYHFFTSLADLVNSLDKNKLTIISNKNEAIGQFDLNASTLLKNASYVCFSKWEGKQALVGSKQAFGISLSQENFNKLLKETKAVIAPISQMALKSSQKFKKSRDALSLNSADRIKIDKFAQTNDFSINAVGWLDSYTDDNNNIVNRYFISGGDGGTPWTARYFTDDALYSFLVSWFNNMKQDPKRGPRVYHFKNGIIGGPESFSLNGQTYSGVYTPADSINGGAKRKLNDVALINPSGNLNKESNGGTFKPHKDPQKNTFGRALSFPKKDFTFKEIIGTGPIKWDSFNKKNPSFNTCSGTKNHLLGSTITGLPIDTLSLFYKNLDNKVDDTTLISAINASRAQKQTINRKDPVAYLDLFAQANGLEIFKKLVNAFNEHEIRVYIPDKLNLEIPTPLISSLILPTTLKCSSGKIINLQNLVNYIMNSTETKTITKDELFKIINTTSNTKNTLDGFTYQVLIRLIELLKTTYSNIKIEFLKNVQGKSTISSTQGLVAATVGDEINTNLKAPKELINTGVYKKKDNTRYKVNIDTTFDLSKAQKIHIYGDINENNDIVVPFKNNLNALPARVGVEAVITAEDEIGRSYLLMVNKPAQAITFFELPGGGLSEINQVNNSSLRKARLLEKLQEKVGIGASQIEDITDLNIQLLYSEYSVTKNKDVLNKISSSVYYLYYAHLKQLLSADDLKATPHSFNTKYPSYLAWIPIDTLETNPAQFGLRYNQIFDIVQKYSKQHANTNIVIDDQEILSEFFNTFWK